MHVETRIDTRWARATALLEAVVERDRKQVEVAVPSPSSEHLCRRLERAIDRWHCLGWRPSDQRHRQRPIGVNTAERHGDERPTREAQHMSLLDTFCVPPVFLSLVYDNLDPGLFIRPLNNIFKAFNHSS